MCVCVCARVVFFLNKHTDLFLFTHVRSKSQRGLEREQRQLAAATCSRPATGEVDFAGHHVLTLVT